ncbi:hypothetical protein H0H93_004642 [Arthromyces matolae]|nr:hypothetical protein H0H93_004642 [Arthromyces matolae]
MAYTHRPQSSVESAVSPSSYSTFSEERHYSTHPTEEALHVYFPGGHGPNESVDSFDSQETCASSHYLDLGITTDSLKDHHPPPPPPPGLDNARFPHRPKGIDPNLFPIPASPSPFNLPNTPAQPNSPYYWGHDNGSNDSRMSIVSTADSRWRKRQRAAVKRGIVRKVKLTKGNFIAEYPVPTAVKNAIEPIYAANHTTEFSHVRYTAATCDPDDFTEANGYSLRTKMYNRETEILIAVTSYNEDKNLYARTLHGVMTNIRDICKTKQSKFWRKDAEEGLPNWQKITVALVVDGLAAMDKSVLDILATVGVYQDGIMKKQVDGKDTVAHIFEYTTQLSVDHKPQLVLPHDNDPNNLVPVQIILIIKAQNQKKINSHRWLFNAVGKQLNVKFSSPFPDFITLKRFLNQPEVCVLIDAGTKPGHKSIYYLWEAFHNDPTLGGCCGEIHAMLKGGKKLLNPLVAAQNFEYKMSNILALKWIYLAFLALQFVLALGNRPKGERTAYTVTLWVYAFLSLYLIICSLWLTGLSFKAIPQKLAEHKSFVETFLQPPLGPLMAAIIATFGIYFFASFLFFDPAHMFHSFPQYMLLAPSFVNVLNVYAFCNLHDVSWGTKGSDKSEALPSLKSKVTADAAVVEDTMASQEDINAAFQETVTRALTKDESEEKREKPTLDDENKTFRTWLVASWMLSNAALVLVVENLNGWLNIEDKQITGDFIQKWINGYGSKRNMYFTVLLYSTFFLALVRFIGCLYYWTKMHLTRGVRRLFRLN